MSGPIYPLLSPERLKEKIYTTIWVEPNGCWSWTGHRQKPLPYGTMYVGGPRRSAQAHRVSYELFVGPIPNGLQIDHLCRNHSCVNPKHLEAVTSRENTLRGISPAARRARQTRCKRGHELQPRGDGKGRRCPVCRKITDALRQALTEGGRYG